MARTEACRATTVQPFVRAEVQRLAALALSALAFTEWPAVALRLNSNVRRCPHVRTASAHVYAAAALLPAVLFVAIPFSEGNTFFLLGYLLMTVLWPACVLYIVFALRSPTVPSEKRRLWVALLFFGSAFVLPFFWFWYVWKPSQARNA